MGREGEGKQYTVYRCISLIACTFSSPEAAELLPPPPPLDGSQVI